MVKYILGAALALSMTTTAFANPSAMPMGSVTYTLANPSGSPYCDGISLTQTGYVAVGYGLYTKCGSASNVNAGGFGTKIRKLDQGTVWVITSTDPFGPGNTYVYLLDEDALQWQVWGMANTGSSSTFHLINSGRLLLGYNSTARGGITATQGRH